MERKGSQILIALVVIMLMAIAAYVKLWSIDYQLSSKEAPLLRLVISSFHFFNSFPFYSLLFVLVIVRFLILAGLLR